MHYDVEIQKVFKISRKDEKSYRNELDNKKLLWHGTRITNVASILMNGLKIAPSEAMVIGCFFGKGHYFSDLAANSMQYCYAKQTENMGILLLCEVSLGNSIQCYHPENMEGLPDGKDSVYGVGKISPQSQHLLDDTIIPWGKPVKDENCDSCLDYNEFVVYNNEQVKIKYLVLLNFIDSSERPF